MACTEIYGLVHLSNCRAESTRGRTQELSRLGERVRESYLAPLAFMVG